LIQVLWQTLIARLLSVPTEARRLADAAREPSRRGFSRGSDGGCAPPAYDASSRSMEISERSASESSKAQEPTPVPRAAGSLGNNLLRQFFAFACPSYPCSGFPEIAGVDYPPRRL